MRQFLAWYLACLWAAIRAPMLRIVEIAGFVGLAGSVLFVLFGRGNEEADWIVGIAGGVAFIVSAAIGPLMIAHRQALDLEARLAQKETDLQDLARQRQADLQAAAMAGQKTVPDAVVPLLSDDAKELLVEGSVDRGGVIMRTMQLGALKVSTNGRVFTPKGDPRSAAQWDAALRSLVELGLVEPRGDSGRVFAFTDNGYRVADIARGAARAPAPFVPAVTSDAEALIIEIAADPDGALSRSRGMHGFSVSTNQRQFITPEDPRSEARWEAAIEELEGLGLIRDKGDRRERFKITDAGYRLAAFLTGNEGQSPR